MGVWEPGLLMSPRGGNMEEKGTRGSVTCILSSGSSVFMASISRAQTSGQCASLNAFSSSSSWQEVKIVLKGAKPDTQNPGNRTSLSQRGQTGPPLRLLDRPRTQAVSAQSDTNSLACSHTHTRIHISNHTQRHTYPHMHIPTAQLDTPFVHREDIHL